MMENDEENLRDEECDITWKVKSRTIWAFGVIGFLADFFFAISFSASQDILEATKIPTSVVLLAASGPACLITVVYPYFLQRVSVFVACCMIFTISVTGMLITSLVDDPVIKIIGVCLVSLGIGGAETVFYSLTSFYGESTINSYALGSGISFLAAPLFYTGLTMLACLSPQVSLLLLTVLWILLPISYSVMEEPRNSNHPNPHPTSFKEIPYSPVVSNSSNTSESRLSCNEMLSLVWQTQPLFIGLFVSCFCKTLLVSGVMTTIAFPNIPVTPRNQYLLYVLASGAGDILGRPYLGFLPFCGIEDKFTVRKPWLLVLVNVFIVIFMVLVSWFRFLSHFFTAAALVLVNTLVTGVVYVNSFQFVGEGLGVEERWFCRALLTGPLSMAHMSVGLIGLTVEYQLREHCVYSFDDVTCFTRSSTAWDPSVSCIV
ncbi:uncharacterized protein LOC144657491 [Oculina patagonica]